MTSDPAPIPRPQTDISPENLEGEILDSSDEKNPVVINGHNAQTQHQIKTIKITKVR